MDFWFYFQPNSKIIIGHLWTSDLWNSTWDRHYFYHHSKTVRKKNLSSTKLISVLPLLVSIDSSPEPLTANMTNTVSCTSYGSNPPAVISWWLDGVRISNMESEVHCFSSLQIGNNFPEPPSVTIDNYMRSKHLFFQGQISFLWWAKILQLWQIWSFAF